MNNLSFCRAKSIFSEDVPLSVSKKSYGTFLFIDDEKLLLECWKKLFENSGLVVLTASNREDALSIFKEEKDSISVVVIDCNLRGYDGLAMYYDLHRIKSGVKVLFTSAATSLPDNMLLPYGEKPPFIQKPFSNEELLCRVDSLFGD